MRHVLRSSPLLALLAVAACAGAKVAAPVTAAPTPTPTATPGATVTIPVGGMSCGGCVRRVTNALQAVDGVRSAEVLLAEQRAVVVYEPARVQPAALVAAIRDAGYEPGEPSVASAPEQPAAIKN